MFKETDTIQNRMEKVKEWWLRCSPFTSLTYAPVGRRKLIFLVHHAIDTNFFKFFNFHIFSLLRIMYIPELLIS